MSLAHDLVKRIASLLVLSLALVSPPPAQAQVPPAWIWIAGDSIDSYAADGSAADMTTHLIEQERNIVIRNFSSAGATLGETGSTGFNNAQVTQAASRSCGRYLNCRGFVIAAGSNDYVFNVPLTQVSASVNRLLDFAQGVQAMGAPFHVLMVDLVWRSGADGAGANTAGYTFLQLRQHRYLLCAARPAVCTFTHRPPVFDVATPSLYALAEQPNNLTHPNVAGHRARADWIESAAAAAGLF